MLIIPHSLAVLLAVSVVVHQMRRYRCHLGQLWSAEAFPVLRRPYPPGKAYASWLSQPEALLVIVAARSDCFVWADSPNCLA